MMQHAIDPFALDCDGFLAGPGVDPDALDIDPVFGKDLARVLWEIREDDPGSIAFDAGTPRTPSDIMPGYAFVDVHAGLLLLAPDGDIAGAYVSCDLSLATEHQRRGLGAELVLEYALRNGGLPTWHLDTPAYSTAGAGAHRAAWRLAQNRPDLVRRKAARLRATAV